MQQVKSSLPQVTGCEGVGIYRGKADRRVFTLLETGESESAHRAPIATLTESGDRDVVRTLLTGDPVSGYHDAL